MVIESWSVWFKRTLQATRRNNSIHSKPQSLRFLPEIEGLEDRCTPSIVGNADFTSTPNGADFNYTITLNNTGTTNIGTFWFAWIPGQDYMANNPISVANPTGWISAVTGGFPGDGYAIRWVATTAPITPGNSLNFNFTSAETPAQLGGNSPFFSNPPEGTSFVYIGAPESDPGYEFVVRAATTTTLADNGPNPSTSGQAVNFTAAVTGGAAINGETVTIEDADNANAVVASPTLTNGTATFDLSDLTVGTHHLFAVYNGDSTHDGSNNSLTPVIQVVNAAPAPEFLSIEVNGGTVQYHDAFGNGSAEPIAGQNSVVEQLLVTFNEPVTLDPGAFSITPYSVSPDGNAGFMEVVVNSGPSPNQVAPILNDPIQVGDGHQWIITFGNNAATTPNGSGFYVLKDGVYSLNIDHTKVTANSQHMAADVGGPGPSSFWALYGDTTFHDISGVDHPGFIGDGYSDASVGNADFQAFKSCDNSDSTNYYAPPNYNVEFDANLDGSVANSDFVQFKTNYNADWQF
jgi:Bacterial Ig-like domain (group 3)